MKTLTTYKKNGYFFSLVQRIEDMAIFLGTKPNSKSLNYEVIKIQSHQGREVHGNYCPPAEYPPSDTEWGQKGWTYPSYLQAKTKLHSFYPTTP